MNKQELRDRNGKLLGKISETSSGKYEIRDINGKLLGKYDEASNSTRDVNGRLIGRGNLLVTFL